jgi:hypothetical protein
MAGVKTNVKLSLRSCVTVLDLTSRKTINLSEKKEKTGERRRKRKVVSKLERKRKDEIARKEVF